MLHEYSEVLEIFPIKIKTNYFHDHLAVQDREKFMD